MIFYLVTYTFLSILSLFKYFKYFFFLIIFLLIIIIGFRYEVGGDWYSYIGLLEEFDGTFVDRFGYFFKDYLFQALLQVLSKFSHSYVILNLVSSIIFLTGMAFYISLFENKILNLTLAFPIYIMIIGMGFTKQSLALGLIFYSLYFMHKNKQTGSITLVLVASFIHIGSFIILFIQLPYLLYTQKKVFNNFLYFIFGICVIFIFYIFYHNHFFFLAITKHLINYLDVNKTVFTDSNILGFFSRALIISSLCFLIINKAITNHYPNIYNFYWFSSMVAIVIVLLGLFLSPVLSDRLLYYFAFIQIFFIGNIHLVIENNKKLIIFKLISILSGFTILLIWLCFSHNSHAWIPYNNMLLL